MFDLQPIAAADRGPSVRGPQDLSGLEFPDHREAFYAVYLNTRHAMLAKPYLVSLGTLNSSLVHPREVFAPAFALGGVCSLIVCHNHPSGDTLPSGDDLDLTARLDKAATILGIQLLDHVIFTDDGTCSIREHGWPTV